MEEERQCVTQGPGLAGEKTRLQEVIGATRETGTESRMVGPLSLASDESARRRAYMIGVGGGE